MLSGSSETSSLMSAEYQNSTNNNNSHPHQHLHLHPHQPIATNTAIGVATQLEFKITMGEGGGGGGGDYTSGFFSVATGATVEEPTDLDILLGRGRVFREHPGNVRFHHVIELHMERYERSNKNLKQVLTDEIVERIKATGSRFLKKNQRGGKWEVASDAVAREKVSHSFRNRRTLASLNPNHKAATSTSSSSSSRMSMGMTTEQKQERQDRGQHLQPTLQQRQLQASILSRPVDTPSSCCMPT
jgi:hypothetical protein